MEGFLKSDLTILLLLKNRHPFTSRWLNYYQKYISDLELFIADGSDTPFSDLFDTSSIENCKYEYSGPDKSVANFIEKTINALSVIKTEYVTMQSNDDFPGRAALDESLKFLETNKDYSLAYGGSVDFSIQSISQPPLYGKVINTSQQGLNLEYDQTEPTIRVLTYLQSGKSFWHAVIRRDGLLKAWISARDAKIDNIQQLEHYINIYLVTSGKFRNYISPNQLYHQVHPEMLIYSYRSFEECLKSPEYMDGISSMFCHLARDFPNLGTPHNFWELAHRLYIQIESESSSNIEQKKKRFTTLVKEKIIFELSNSKMILKTKPLLDFRNQSFGKDAEFIRIVDFLSRSNIDYE